MTDSPTSQHGRRATRRAMLLTCLVTCLHSTLILAEEVAQTPEDVEAQGDILVLNRTGVDVEVQTFTEAAETYQSLMLLAEGSIFTGAVAPNAVWVFRTRDGTYFGGQYLTTADEDQVLLLDVEMLAAAGVPGAGATPSEEGGDRYASIASDFEGNVMEVPEPQYAEDSDENWGLEVTDSANPLDAQ